MPISLNTGESHVDSLGRCFTIPAPLDFQVERLMHARVVAMIVVADDYAICYDLAGCNSVLVRSSVRTRMWAAIQYQLAGGCRTA